MKFADASAFRTSLETRLNAKAKAGGKDLNRLRTQVAFERFLHRVFERQPNWVLKGGYALEIRLHDRARATVDLDLQANSDQRADLLETLQQAVQAPMTDHFEFSLRLQGRGLAGPPEGGQRYHVEARLAGRAFARFHVDIGLGDLISGDVQWLEGQVDLTFAALPPTRLRVYPLISHFAEKVHAYTRPREQQTRVKDLVDLALLLPLGLPADVLTWQALQATFERYGTHPLPDTWPPPPAHWDSRFAQMAAQTGLHPKEMAYWDQHLRTFWTTLRRGREASGG